MNETRGRGEEGEKGAQGQPGPIVRLADVGAPSQGGRGGTGGRGGNAPRQRPVLNAVRLLFVATALLYVSLGGVILLLSISARHQRRVICQQVEVVRQVLYTEHVAKLNDNVRYLRAHPDGAPSVGISRSDLLKSIADERTIVDATTPKACP